MQRNAKDISGALPVYITRDIARCLRFFTLIQCFCLPPQYGRSLCFETNPYNPNSHALRNRSGPISPCSNGAMKMPSVRPAKSRGLLHPSDPIPAKRASAQPVERFNELAILVPIWLASSAAAFS